MPFLSQKKFMLTNKNHIKHIFTAVMLFVDTKSKNRNFRLSRKRHEKCRKNTEKWKKKLTVDNISQSQTGYFQNCFVSIMLTTVFFVFWKLYSFFIDFFSEFRESPLENQKDFFKTQKSASEHDAHKCTFNFSRLWR